jgi:NDP-sugar pyrophosphorylase family protein
MGEIKINHALIMAAGRGNRMRPLTDLLPKSMIPYNGDTLIGNSLNKLTKSIQYIHVTVGYKKAMLSEYLMTKGVDTIINTEGHGNAWWITNTIMKYIDEPIIVMTTDNITEIDSQFLLSQYEHLGYPPCMLVPVKPIDGIDGDFINQSNGTVISINRAEKSEIYCSGIQVINPNKIFQLGFNDDNFYDIWNNLIRINELKVSSIYPKIWFSVDTLENLARITSNGELVC